MAAKTLSPQRQDTPEAKLSAYKSLCEINEGFSTALAGLRNLESAGFVQTVFFTPKHLNEFSGLTRELQADINHSLLNAMQEIEKRDAFRFGKIRAKREKK